jgi:outer membrane protein TolC
MVKLIHWAALETPGCPNHGKEYSLMVEKLKMLMPLVALVLRGQGTLSIQEAIQTAWARQAGLQAGEAMVAKAQADAAALRYLRMPTASLGIGFMRTDEPMMAFGTQLDQARISQMDFMPSKLNHPDAIQGTGASLTLSQPLYAGGRLDAARRAGAAMAGAEASSQAFRRQQVAYAITQAYFGAQVAEQALRYAEDTLRQAVETERFVLARVEQGLMLKSEGERTRAYRAQSEAGVVEARSRIASARSALTLLVGSDLNAVPLSTPVEGSEATLAGSGQRGDLQAARLQSVAAQEGVKASLGSLKPEVGLQVTAGTMRQTWNTGGNWTTASLGAKWNFSWADTPRVSAARAMARAAELGLRWQEAVASREVEEARRSIATAESKIAFARTALEASESVRAIRTARHREGLLPLVEVLDAESALTGARTLLLASQLERRLGQAQLALALGQPIENVKE